MSTRKRAIERARSETEFRQMLEGYAEARGWDWMHVKTAMYGRHHVTATHGTLGKGWPDLFLVRAGDKRVLFVECKRPGEGLRPDQARVLAALAAAGLDCRVWDDTCWIEIERVLA